jgi:hypothetical protein
MGPRGALFRVKDSVSWPSATFIRVLSARHIVVNRIHVKPLLVEGRILNGMSDEELKIE